MLYLLFVMIKLYDHQKKALNNIKNGSILCGDVGSGKSITALAYYYTKVCDGNIEPFKKATNLKELYIITTARKRDELEWDKEIEPFGIKKYKVDSWNNIKKYVNISNAFFIFDEQRVVGSGSWVKSFLKIAKINKWILLSATPGDTWTDYIPVFIANGFYKNKTEFITRHIVYNRFVKYPQVKKYLETGRLLKLRNSIIVEMDYQKPTERKELYLESNYNKELYKNVNSKRWNAFEERPIKSITELCFILRKIVNMDESKLIFLHEIYKDKKKIIVFYNFIYELDILKNFCNNFNIKYSEWNGNIHEPIPKDDKWIYLVQYTAGAEGWNCIQTDTIVFFSLNYSYKIMKQSAGRIDRLNTPYKILYYYYFKSSAPIDLAINRALKNKKKFNETKFVSSQENHRL